MISRPCIRIKGEAFIQSDRQGNGYQAGVALTYPTIFTGTRMLCPSLYDKDLLVLSGSFVKAFYASGFQLRKQTTGSIYHRQRRCSDFPWLPSIRPTTGNSHFLKGHWLQIWDLISTYTTKYKASAYMPATGVFHLQDEYDVGGYPFLDVFLAFRVKRTRIFAILSTISCRVWVLLGITILRPTRYPMKPRHFRFGTGLDIL